jgi:transcriptional regulator with XRE-family HTH domain
MDQMRVGLALRALRRRKGLRQIDVAAAVGLDQSTISLVERGHWDRLALRTVQAIFAVVDARFVADIRWRGGQLDRLLDERHARLVGVAAGKLARAGWDVTVEATFARYGERGFTDILAVRRASAMALVVEVKSELTSLEAMLRSLDAKTRLASVVCLERSGWRPATVSRMLVLPSLASARRRVARERALITIAFPDGPARCRRWIHQPEGRLSGVWFVSDRDPGHARPGIRAPAAPAFSERDRTHGSSSTNRSAGLQGRSGEGVDASPPRIWYDRGS